MKKQMTKQMTKYVKYLLLVVVLLGMTTACTKKQELAKEKEF